MTDHQYKSKRFFTISNFVPDIRYKIILQQFYKAICLIFTTTNYIFARQD